MLIYKDFDETKLFFKTITSTEILYIVILFIYVTSMISTNIFIYNTFSYNQNKVTN